MKDSDRELTDLKERNDSLNAALTETEKMLKASQDKREAQKKISIMQASYTAAMGSIMGSMLWKTSKTESVINTYISEVTWWNFELSLELNSWTFQSMIREFISMANVTLNSFVESYEKKLPMVESNEFKMMISVLGKIRVTFVEPQTELFSSSGVCVNISAHISGREFVVNEGIGITFIENILKYLGIYPMPSGHLLKRMSLMFLFNVIILRRGARIVKASPNGVANILGCLSPDHTDEIHLLVLEFMVFLIEQIYTEDFIQQIRNLVSEKLFLFQWVE